MNTSEPLISVILPVYNGEKTIESSINSILNQVHQHFELLVIDDGSIDDSFKIANSIKDVRIQTFRNYQNLGLVPTLNRGISLSRGDFIARQDQDDLSHPLRFTEQVLFLEGHNEYDLVGTWAEVSSRNDSANGTPPATQLCHPTTDVEIKWQLLWRNPFVHSSVMLRARVLLESGVYSQSQELVPPEDYELWSRISRTSKMANIPIKLVTYFHSETGMSANLNEEILDKSERISLENLKRAFPKYPEHRLLQTSRLVNGCNSYTNSYFGILISFIDSIRMRRYFRKQFGVAKSTPLPLNYRNFFKAIAMTALPEKWDRSNYVKSNT